MKILLMVLQMLPLLLEVIKSVEKFIPGSGNGKEKLIMVKDIITTTYTEAATLMPVIEKIVGIAVSTANKTGAFDEAKPVVPAK